MSPCLKSREFVQRLIALETPAHPSQLEVPAFVACARLHPQLAMLMGNAGFTALLTRALSLASTEVDWLATVRIHSDGTLSLPAQPTIAVNSEQLAEGGSALMIQLLGLLAEFIGQDLTLRLLEEAWPALSGPSGNGVKIENSP